MSLGRLLVMLAAKPLAMLISTDHAGTEGAHVLATDAAGVQVGDLAVIFANFSDASTSLSSWELGYTNGAGGQWRWKVLEAGDISSPPTLTLDPLSAPAWFAMLIYRGPRAAAQLSATAGQTGTVTPATATLSANAMQVVCFAASDSDFGQPATGVQVTKFTLSDGTHRAGAYDATSAGYRADPARFTFTSFVADSAIILLELTY